MAEENKICYPTHKWNGAIVIVRAEILEVQHPDLIGKPCDCGRFVWNEKECGCAIKTWQSVWDENPNH